MAVWKKVVAKSIAESFEEMPFLAAAAPVKGAFPLSCVFTGKGENDAVFRGAVVVDADNSYWWPVVAIQWELLEREKLWGVVQKRKTGSKVSCWNGLISLFICENRLIFSWDLFLQRISRRKHPSNLSANRMIMQNQ